MAASSPTRPKAVVIGGENSDRNDGRRQVPRTADLNRLKQQLTVVTSSYATRVSQIQRCKNASNAAVTSIFQRVIDPFC